MDWKRLFGSAILERGRRYYQAGCVNHLEKDGNRFVATVKGTRSYKVSITIKNDQVSRMSCTCPHAADGNWCKHMAAVLYQIEEQGVLCHQEALPLETEADAEAAAIDRELFDNAPQRYSYFDCAAMKAALPWDAKRWVDAVQMARKGTVRMLSAKAVYLQSYGASPSGEMGGEVKGIFTQGNHQYLITFLLKRDKIYKATCGVRGCSRYYTSGFYNFDGLCVHQMALFYHLAQYLKTHSLGDATDWSGAAFLNYYRRFNVGDGSVENALSAPLLTLEPRLQNDCGQWNLSFRIGSQKMYVVKNLSELLAHSRKNETMIFGSSTMMNVGKENFTALGKQYLQFIQEISDEEQLRIGNMSLKNYNFQLEPVEFKGAIPLFGRRLDDFFDMMEARSIEYVNKTSDGKETGTLHFGCMNPRVQLSLQKHEDSQGIFQGIRISGQIPQVVHGQKASYFIKDNCLNRVDKSYSDALRPLLEQEEDGMVHFLVGRNRLAEFYYHVLPQLREHADIKEPDAEYIGNFLPPMVKFIFYLDSEDSNVTCRAEAVYGEQAFSLMDSSDLSSSFRDESGEKEADSLVRTFLPYMDLQKGVFHCGANEEIIYRLLNHGIDELLHLGEVQATDRFKRLSIQRAPKFAVGISLSHNLLELTISSSQISHEELLEVINSYQSKKKFHRLKDGTFLKLEENSIETLSNIMESLRLSPRDFVKDKMQIPAYRALYLDKMLENKSEIYTSRDRRFKALVKDFKTVAESEFEAPDSLKKILRPYQVLGYQWLRMLDTYGFGGILADEMGLGKTLQVIAVLLAAKEEEKLEPSLIVAPASLVYNWREELCRFAPMLKVCMVTGTQAERARKLKDAASWDVFVTSYDLLKRDIAEYEGLSFGYQILDEAQYIKNHTTAVAKSVKLIDSRTRYALTGTPIENRLSELWSIFDFLMPGFLYPYETFRKTMESPIVKNSDTIAAGRLKNMVAPFILRRLKADVLSDLPEKLEEVRFAVADSPQQKLYDGQVTRMHQMLDEQDNEHFQKNKIQILAELTRIRQICCDPSLCFENYKGGSAKREACLDLIASAIEGEHKILVFSQFTSMLELLESDLDHAGISHYTITGKTPKEERLRLVNAFNEDSVPVFLISLKAGGTGLNLTGADVVIHYDPWWNLAVQNQATDRAHRIGQKKIVTVYKLIIKDSIEEKILHMQEAKKELADEILNGETGTLGKLSRDELLELLGN